MVVDWTQIQGKVAEVVKLHDCRVENCTNQVEGRQWYCDEHRTKRCAVENCDRQAKSVRADYCIAHDARFKEYGDVMEDVPLQSGPGRPRTNHYCHKEGCDRQARTRGMCQNHYHEWWVALQRRANPERPVR